jgi:hypothetical protein
VPKKSPPSPPELPVTLRVPIDDARAKLEQRVAKGGTLRARSLQTQTDLEDAKRDYQSWSAYNNDLLIKLFTTDKLAREYSFWGIAVGTMNASLQTLIGAHYANVDEKIHRLESILSRLELYAADVVVTSPLADSSADRNNRKESFVVHGHAGLNRLGGMWIYINRGAGYWGPPMRFGVPSEITLIRLVRG